MSNYLCVKVKWMHKWVKKKLQYRLKWNILKLIYSNFIHRLFTMNELTTLKLVTADRLIFFRFQCLPGWFTLQALTWPTWVSANSCFLNFLYNCFKFQNGYGTRRQFWYELSTYKPWCSSFELGGFETYFICLFPVKKILQYIIFYNHPIENSLMNPGIY